MRCTLLMWEVKDPKYITNLHLCLHLSILFVACDSPTSTYAGHLNVCIWITYKSPWILSLRAFFFHSYYLARRKIVLLHVFNLSFHRQYFFLVLRWWFIFACLTIVLYLIYLSAISQFSSDFLHSTHWLWSWRLVSSSIGHHLQNLLCGCPWTWLRMTCEHKWLLLEHSPWLLTLCCIFTSAVTVLQIRHYFSTVV